MFSTHFYTFLLLLIEELLGVLVEFKSPHSIGRSAFGSFRASAQGGMTTLSLGIGGNYQQGKRYDEGLHDVSVIEDS